MRRIVVTGIGTVSPLGVGTEHCWRQLLEGASGIGPVTACDVSDMPARIAGEVPSGEPGNAKPGELDLDQFVEKKERRKIGRYISLSMVASDEALKDAGWTDLSEEQAERTGVLIGAGIGGLEGIYDTSVSLYERGPRRVSPFFIPSCLINLASGNVSIRYGLKGPNHSVVTACSTGAHAIGDAARLIQHGDADVMLAGGTESTICRIGIAGFAAARALSMKYNDCPTEASRPWNKGRDGFVMGEGAGLVVLESLEHAQARGAKIYGELVGYGMSGDAHHVTAPAGDGDGAYRAMRACLRSAEVAPGAVDYINAHGTSTPLGDMAEVAALKRVFGDAPDVSISSTKSAIGHLLGAAGSVEAIFSILALRDKVVPPTLNLTEPDEGCAGLDLVPLTAKERAVRYALSNSFGFGGTNASLLFRAMD